MGRKKKSEPEEMVEPVKKSQPRKKRAPLAKSEPVKKSAPQKTSEPRKKREPKKKSEPAQASEPEQSSDQARPFSVQGPAPQKALPEVSQNMMAGAGLFTFIGSVIFSYCLSDTRLLIEILGAM